MVSRKLELIPNPETAMGKHLKTAFTLVMLVTVCSPCHSQLVSLVRDINTDPVTSRVSP